MSGQQYSITKRFEALEKEQLKQNRAIRHFVNCYILTAKDFEKQTVEEGQKYHEEIQFLIENFT